jgi:hypothetical protein
LFLSLTPDLSLGLNKKDLDLALAKALVAWLTSPLFADVGCLININSYFAGQ